MIDLKNKKVGVVGLSKRTGVSVAKFLLERNIDVLVTDVKSKKDIQNEINLLKDYEFEYELDGHGEKTLDCDVLVVSPGVPLNLDIFNKARKKGIKIISEIELAYEFTEAKIIAITGTNGKTTTTSLLGEIMSSHFHDKVVVAGNIGTPLISVAPKLSHDNWIIAEISSFQLEAIENFRPDISIFLNFSPDHLDRHKSLEDYLAAKKKIFINQKNKDLAIVNLDDETVLKAVSDFSVKKHYVSGEKEVENGAYISKESINLVNKNLENKQIAIKDIPLPGNHNLMNVAFASYAAYMAGVDIKTIKKSIKKYKADQHRLEIIMSKEDSSMIVDDSKATNVDAAIKAIDTFNKPIILIAGGQDRNADFSKFADKIKNNVKSLILLGETSKKINNEVLKRGFENIYQVRNMNEAVDKAFNNFEKGDCILLSPACPSWDMYEDYKERGNIFQQEIKKRV